MTNMNFGCCGRDRELRGLLAAADMHPRTTRAGQRARARLACAMLERRATAFGDLATAVKARRGLASLGTTADDAARQDAVRAAISTIRAARGAEGTESDRLRARRDARIGRDVETVLTALQAAVSIADSIARAEANNEAARAASQGREPNYSARDVARALGWMRWIFGGALPVDVAESDIRLLGSVFEVALPVTTFALTEAKLAAQSDGNTGLRDALAGIETYLASVGRAIRAAVAALPPPAPAPTPGTVGPPTGLAPCPVGQIRVNGTCVSAARPVGPDGSYIDLVRCSDGSYASSASRCPATTEKKSSGVLLALPVAALAWYLFM